jgi:hypothetical protein
MRDSGHEIKITSYKTNQNKIKSLIYYPSIIEG